MLNLVLAVARGTSGLAKWRYNIIGRKSIRMDDRLREALKGIALTEREERYLEWLSRMDSETVEVFAELIERIKKVDK